eukprot:TRINITY_DN73766_c0_g1_i1.p1 TRINITY_DN73766_c0_g1~~TRINITY_DN73766_c0_g1_i1.p1  ORF type:complete len:410 (-),score=75.12 TRINITY_DN73766_c0_g1_i1:610-1839(-)
MSLVAIGVGCEVAATVLGTVGKQLVSYSAKPSTTDELRALLKYTGLTITTLLGPILDAAAYAMAPQSIIAPLDGLDVVWNTCSAPCTLGERLAKSHIVGTALIFLGSALSPLFGPHEERMVTLESMQETYSGWRFLTYMLGIGGVLLISFYLILVRPHGTGDAFRGIGLGVTAGAIAGNMFLLSDSLGLLRTCIQTGNWTAYQHFLPYLILVSAIVVAVLNIPFMTKGLEEFDALFMVATFTGTKILVASISAEWVLLEMVNSSWADTICYWMCLVVMFAGLAVVGRKTIVTQQTFLAMQKEQLRKEQSGRSTENAENGYQAESAEATTTSEEETSADEAVMVVLPRQEFSGTISPTSVGSLVWWTSPLAGPAVSASAFDPPTAKESAVVASASAVAASSSSSGEEAET